MIKLSTNQLMVYSCILFASSTLLQGFPALDALNRVFVAFILFLLIIGLFFSKMTVSSFVMVLVTAMLTLISVWYNVGPVRINNVTYFGFWVLLFLYMRNHYDEFIQSLHDNINMVHVFVLLWTILVIASFFYPDAYQRSWGGDFFRSFATGSHRMASVCTTILAAAVILAHLKDNKRYLLYLLVPMILILISGARTYLGVAFLFTICLYYCYCPNRRFFYWSIIPITIIMLTIAYFSPAWDKMLYTVTVVDTGGDTEQFLRRLSSGRTYIWASSLDYYFDLSPWRQIVGDGADATLRANNLAFGKELFAHNDFINLLICNGYLGVFVYLSSFLSFTIRAYRKTNAPFLIKAGIFIIWFFNAMMNQAYTYPAFVLSLPLLFYALTIRYGASNSGPETSLVFHMRPDSQLIDTT